MTAVVLSGAPVAPLMPACAVKGDSPLLSFIEAVVFFSLPSGGLFIAFVRALAQAFFIR